MQVRELCEGASRGPLCLIRCSGSHISRSAVGDGLCPAGSSRPCGVG